jgi:phospholipid/cholesterol/gamma-HCH transport system substrate-binding protein
MSKEIRIGLITIITMATMIWLFQYLKGRNILKKVTNFEVVYSNVEGLKVAAPIEINGFIVGSVSDIRLNPDDVRSMLITFDVQGEYKLPTSTIAILSADNSLVGTKKIILDFDHPCDDDCAKGGQRFEAGYRGVLEAMLGKDEIKEYLGELREEMGPIVDTLLHRLGDKESDNVISNSLNSLEESLGNLASLTSSMDRLMTNSYEELNTTIENMAVLSTSLASANQDIETMLSNMSELSQQLVDADLGTALKKTGETFDNTNELLESLQETTAGATKSFDTINDLLAKIEDGDGTMAKLFNDPDIYDNLKETSMHLALLLQDMRLNPKRYVRLSVFGRKGNPYISPDEDPAFDEKKIEEEAPLSISNK